MRAVGDWNPIAKPCNFFLLEGKKSPGHAVIEGNNGSPRKWDERGGYGLTGSTIVFTGLGLAEFDAIISLYDERDWREWLAWAVVLEPPKPGRRDAAKDIWHPLLRAKPLSIGKVVVKNVAIPKQTEEGIWQVLIPMQAFRRPKITLIKPDGAKAAESDDPVERKIAANSAKIDKMLAELSK